MKILYKIIIAIIVLALLFLLYAHSVRVPAINGVIKIDNQPVEGVKVTVTGMGTYLRKGETIISDKQGRFHTGAQYGLRPLLFYSSHFNYGARFEYKDKIYYWTVAGEGDLTDEVDDVTCLLVDQYDHFNSYGTCRPNEPQ